MTGVKHVFLLFLAASTLVVSAYSEAAAIRYDVTNATSVQNGYSLSGYIEVSGTGTISSNNFASFNFTATKADNPTLTFDSGNGGGFVENMFATDSALYLLPGSTFQIAQEGRYFAWSNDYFQSSFYQAQSDNGSNIAWDSGSYPITVNQSWQIGSAQAVPEPSTYAMALAGLACGGYSMFRRRKRA